MARIDDLTAQLATIRASMTEKLDAITLDIENLAAQIAAGNPVTEEQLNALAEQVNGVSAINDRLGDIDNMTPPASV